MTQLRAGFIALLATLVCAVAFGQAQQTATTNTSVVVPPLVNFTGTLSDVNGKPLTGTVGVTFSLYKDEQGGSPLWIETQNIQPDKNGHYTVQLGAASSQGLPSDLFSSGEARWLGVQAQGQAEQPRAMLLSVPYAMKAGDATTIGGLPPSAFVLAAPGTTSGSTSGSGSPDASVAAAIGGSGTADFIPIWTAAAALGNSVLFQSGSGNSAFVGINTTTPASTLDVNGGVTSRGDLQLPSTGTANASQGYNSQPLVLQGSVYNSGTGSAVGPLFQWQTEPSRNNTTNPSGTLNLLYGAGSGSPTETGLNIASNGQITFATGQTFPGTGNGTITGVNAGVGLSGGGTSGSVTLANTGILSLTSGTGISVSSGQTPTVAINTSVVPQLNSANNFTGNQGVTGNVSATGVVTGSSFNIGSNLFAFGSYANENAFLGFAGNTTMTGGGNTASGGLALYSNTQGVDNTASGNSALYSNTIGVQNTASGTLALASNTTGIQNAAFAFNALAFNSTGSYNTAVGNGALTGGSGVFNDTPNADTAVGSGTGQTIDLSALTGSLSTALGASAKFSTGSLNNATAIGAQALVSVSNALVLGSINGVNGATASVDVGIGTTTPSAPLDIAAQNIHTYIGAPCNTGTYAGIAFGTLGFQNCTNYSLQGDGTNTYVNAPSGGKILFRVNNLSGPSVMEITSGGLVGIGTNSPDAQLSVDGGADKPGGGSWGTFSDRRLKTLDGSFTSGLSQIVKINPVRYRYKADNGMGIRDQEEHVGLVAQDVQKVIPEAVSENSKGYLLVNNDPIIWTMLNAIKEQQKQIATQQKRIRAQQARINALASQVRTIQAEVQGNGQNRLLSAKVDSLSSRR